MAEGLKPEQIAKRRGLTPTTIYDHLAQLISKDKVNVEDVVPEEVRQQIEAAIKQVGNTDYLMPIKTLLPDDMSYGVVRCVVEGWKRSRPSPDTDDNKTKQITLAILDCIRALPGKLPRSGVAKLLVESQSGRVEEFQTHPMYKLLPNCRRDEVMIQIDKLLESGKILKDEHGYLILPKSAPKNTADAIDQYLSTSHPRPLHGPWQAGWALGFHSSFAGAEWNRSSTGELAFRLKYQGDLDAIPPLVEQSMALITEHPELAQVDAMLPVPPSSLRPVDPVNTFANALAQRMRIPTQKGLVKTRQTSPQKELHTLAQKHANVAGAFAIQTTVHGKRLLVIDDLFDSGATLEEITRLLQKAGAARVCVFTLTRTIHSDA